MSKHHHDDDDDDDDETRRILDLVRNAKYYQTSSLSTFNGGWRSNPGPGTQSVTSGWDAPPDGYVCFRCNKPGHYKRFCPTIGDAKFDPIKPLTTVKGIPCTLLREVDDESSGAGFLLHGGKKVQLNLSGWRTVRSPYTPAVPDYFRCLICRHILKNAVLVHCCHVSYCWSCVYGGASAFDMQCVACRQIIDLDKQISPNKTLQQCVNRWSGQVTLRRWLLGRPKHRQ